MEASAASGAPARRPPAPLPTRLLRLAGDERLVEHVRAGSQTAFTVLYDRHHRAILGFCRHMLGDATEAEDAVQHTFMAAYRDLVGSDKPIQLKPWLYTIARNRCLSILRARRERPSDELEIVSTESLGAEVQRRQDLQDLLRDVAQLSEDQRAALVLSELGDVSHEEIATVLGCQREQVKALVFQARTSLSASRKARDTDCTEIREQLATLRGGALRRNTLRRHLRECDGCREFADAVKTQRRQLALVLPVIPTLGLKESALAAAFGSGGTGAAAGAAAVAGSGAAGVAATAGGGGAALAAKAAVVVALAGGGGAVGINAISNDTPSRTATPASQTAAPGEGGAPQGGVPAPASAGGQETAERAREGDTPIKRRVRKNRKDKQRGKDTSKTAGANGKALANGKGKAVGHGKTSGSAVERARKNRAAAKRKAVRRKAARRRAAKPRPTPTPKPRPTATPKPTPSPEPTVAPTEERGKGGGSGDAGEAGRS